MITELSDVRFEEGAYESWPARQDIDTFDWACRNIHVEDGGAFNPDQYPWARGIFNEWDNPRRRVIWEMMASRLGKTTNAHVMLISAIANCPSPAMLATATEHLAKRRFKKHLYRLLENCDATCDLLPPLNRRLQTRVDLPAATIYAAWAGSISTLSDIEIRFGHASEVDKWNEDASSEADSLQLFFERGKNVPDAKFVVESTPAIRRHSRIESGLLQSTNCRFGVHCPWCHKSQVLKRGGGKPGEGGVIWDHNPDGHSDADLALKTARYVCEHCRREIHDEQRPRLMQSGVWIPEGCWVDSMGRIKGQQRRDGSDAGFQLSSLYAPTITWGRYAESFVKSKGHPRRLQNHVNSWDGQTFELHRQQTKPEQLGERLGTDLPRGTVPAEATFITVGIDKQGAAGGFYPYLVLAWGPEERCHLVEFGIAETTAELLAEVIRYGYPHEDGGPPMVPALTLIDSSYDTKAVYDFCAGTTGVYPCKGQDSSVRGEAYQLAQLGLAQSHHARKRIAAPGQTLVHVGTDYWETELQHRLDDRRPGEPGSTAFCREAAKDGELLEQLLNGAQEDKINARGVGKLLWVKRDASAPNDFRDSKRYAMCAAKIYLDDRQGRLPVRPRAQTHTQAQARRSGSSPGAAGGHQRPDGRPWI